MKKIKDKVVLIVEDERPLSEAIEMALQSAGYKTVVKANGKEGLDYSLSHRPDLLLLDQSMPVMSGNQVLEKLRKDKWGQKARVIVMTNMNDVATMNTSLSLGVTDYVLKSEMELAEILTMVDNKLHE